jgi:hypothetical protein
MALFRSYYLNCETYDDVTGKTTGEPNVPLPAPFGGQIYCDGNTTATVITTTDTYVKIAGTTTAVNLKGFDTDSSDNKLRYIEEETHDFLVSAVICGDTTANNRTFKAQLFKNGVGVANAVTCTDYQIANRANEMSIRARISLAKNDYIEVFIKNVDTTDDPTIGILSMDVVQV